MAASKSKLQKDKDIYIKYDIEWLEGRIKSMKDYVDKHPLEEVTDRVEWRTTSNGGSMPVVVATVESQIKLLKEILKELPGMLSALNELKQKEAVKKIEARGTANIPWRMRKDLSK